jgi:signal transduction histidine kinase
MQIGDGDARSDVAQILPAIIDGFRGDDFAVQLDMPAHIPAVAAPSATLEAVATTILENSRQAGAANVDIAVRSSGGNVTLDFIDNGPGIAAGDRARIFDAFFTTKRGEGGTGLGLAIARSLVQASNGELHYVPSETGTHLQLVLNASG